MEIRLRSTVENCLANRGEMELRHKQFLMYFKINAVNKIRIFSQNSVKLRIYTTIRIFAYILSNTRTFNREIKIKHKWAFELVSGPWAAYSLVGLDLELFKLLVILGLS